MTSRAKVLLLVGALGCGGRSAGPRDAGADAPPASGVVAFDVTAFVRPARDGGVFSVPQSSTFTLVLDVEAGRVIAGGTGRGAVVPVAINGRTVISMGRFSVGIPSANACSGATEIAFHSFELSVTGTTLQGTAKGAAQVSCGDCIFDEPITATLSGVADAKTPFLLGSASVATPFEGFAVLTSEPLPATAKARLVAGDGSTVQLEPTLVEGTPPLIIGFHKPEVVLRPGEGYSVGSDGLVDFVGHAGTDEAPLRLVSFKAAPLIPEDGFESATGATLGGANLIRVGPLAPIGGAVSAYVGGASAPAAGTVTASPSLNVRLALQPGDTKLRFAYRLVGLEDAVPFGGTVHFGSVGHAPSTYNQLPAPQPGTATIVEGRMVFISPVATAEYDLPADAQGELVVSIATFDNACGGGILRPSGMLVDDLRVE